MIATDSWLQALQSITTCYFGFRFSSHRVALAPRLSRQVRSEVKHDSIDRSTPGTLPDAHHTLFARTHAFVGLSHEVKYWPRTTTSLQ